MGSTGDRHNLGGPPPAAPRRPSVARGVPVRLPEHAHLRLDGLRDYRAARRCATNSARPTTGELSCGPGWTRCRPARQAQPQEAPRTLDAHTLRRALQTERVNAGRDALRRLVPGDDLPELPDLAELWARPVAAGDQTGRAQLDSDLLAAAARVSDYRRALLRRLERAHGEHIARYRDQPGLCLSALPLPPGWPAAVRGTAT